MTTERRKIFEEVRAPPVDRGSEVSDAGTGGRPSEEGGGGQPTDTGVERQSDNQYGDGDGRTVSVIARLTEDASSLIEASKPN